MLKENGSIGQAEPPAAHMTKIHRGCPAYAGMLPRTYWLAASRRGLPRIRGDAPMRAHCRSKGFEVAPHTRGCSPRRRHARHPGQGCPAYAGMLPSSRRACGTRDRLPRPRGDAPRQCWRCSNILYFAPQTRGCYLLYWRLLSIPNSLQVLRDGIVGEAGLTLHLRL